jgi:DinB family protein
MDNRTLLQQQLGVSHQIIKQCLSDVSDDDARRMPNPTLSPIIWQVGHLAVINARFIQGAGAAPPPTLPANYPDLFKTGTGGKAAYPPVDGVVRAFDDTHEALMRVVAEAKLDTPSEGPRGLWKNTAEMFGFSNTHRWYHIGKITTLRALLGKPRLFG